MVETSANDGEQENDENEYFAYGKNTYDNCVCPAVAAGYDMGTDFYAHEIAGEYDIVVSNKYAESWEGIIPEEIARKAWLEAIDNIWDDDDVAQTGEEIAKELGWLR